MVFPRHYFLFFQVIHLTPVPGVIVQAVRESGEGGLHAGRVACRGEDVHVNGHVTSGVVTESYFQIRVAEEYFETDAQKVEAQAVPLNAALSVPQRRLRRWLAVVYLVAYADLQVSAGG